MSEPDRLDAPEVDFVVGPTVDPGADEMLDTGPPRRTALRLVVGIGIVALVIVGIFLAHHNSSAHKARPVASSGPATGVPGSTSPSSETIATATPATPIQVTLRSDLCPPRRGGCFHPATSKRVETRIRAAFVAAFGGVSRLRIRDAAIALDDPPRRSLFARGITAVTPFGRVAITAAAVQPDHVPLPSIGTSALATETTNGDYSLAGSVQIRGESASISLDQRLEKLINDRRLVG